MKRHFAFFLQPLYVGKAANLRGRLLGHEKWGKAWWILGATERHVLRIGSEDERRMVEEDLIRGLKPRMNDVQMPRSENDAPNTPQLRKGWIWRRQVENFVRKTVRHEAEACRSRPTPTAIATRSRRRPTTASGNPRL